MFWDNKELTMEAKDIKPIYIPAPRKKEYKTMISLIEDSEKYDSNGEKEVSKKVLLTLIDYINSL